MANIQQWNEIKEDFTDTLVLGNGASIAVDRKFSYKSLLETARTEKFITKDVERVFKHFGTNDFEFVLHVIFQAHHVNQALSIKDSKTERVYRDIQAALIQAVQEVHATYDVVEPYLERIMEFMKRFKFVISLNYDLIVYWAMMKGKDKYGPWLKDAFIIPIQRSWFGHDLGGLSFEEDWGFLLNPYEDVGGATLIFYPHGNLMLSTDVLGNDMKITRKNPEVYLLDTVLDLWRSGEAMPLFVSEGESQQKERAIQRNKYLQAIFKDALPKAGPNIAVLGWSMSENDGHLLRQLCMGETKAIAVSVHMQGKSTRQIEYVCATAKSKILKANPKTKVTFFDATSSGCWIN